MHYYILDILKTIECSEHQFWIYWINGNGYLNEYCRSCAFGKEDNPTASDSLWIESPAELYSNRRSTQHREKTARTTAEATADGLINIQLWFDVKQIKAQLTFSTELSSATRTTTIFKCTVDSVVGRREALDMMSRARGEKPLAED